MAAGGGAPPGGCASTAGRRTVTHPSPRLAERLSARDTVAVEPAQGFRRANACNVVAWIAACTRAIYVCSTGHTVPTYTAARALPQPAAPPPVLQCSLASFCLFVFGLHFLRSDRVLGGLRGAGGSAGEDVGVRAPPVVGRMP